MGHHLQKTGYHHQGSGSKGHPPQTSGSASRQDQCTNAPAQPHLNGHLLHMAHCSRWGKCGAWGPHQMGMRWLMGLATRWWMEMGTLSRAMAIKSEVQMAVAEAEEIPMTAWGQACGEGGSLAYMHDNHGLLSFKVFRSKWTRLREGFAGAGGRAIRIAPPISMVGKWAQYLRMSQILGPQIGLSRDIRCRSGGEGQKMLDK